MGYVFSKQSCVLFRDCRRLVCALRGIIVQTSQAVAALVDNPMMLDERIVACQIIWDATENEFWGATLQPGLHLNLFYHNYFCFILKCLSWSLLQHKFCFLPFFFLLLLPGLFCLQYCKLSAPTGGNVQCSGRLLFSEYCMHALWFILLFRRYCSLLLKFVFRSLHIHPIPAILLKI